jgi:hypothetical protein
MNLFYVASYLTGGRIVSWVLNKSCGDLKSPPNDVDPDLWDALQPPSDESEYAGSTLGLLERLLAFFVACQSDSAYLILLGGYLTFKLGSKWPVWQHVFHYPSSLDSVGIDSLEYMKATRLWGGMSLMRFVIGTTLNMMIGIFAGHFAQWVWIKWISIFFARAYSTYPS